MTNLSRAEEVDLAIQDYLENGVSIIDALVLYAEENDIEVEVVGDIVRRSQNLRVK
jgi:hypothetical protein